MLNVLTDPRCLGHHSPPGYPELPQRLEVIVEHLRASAWSFAPEAEVEVLTAAARTAVSGIHEAAYVSRLEAAIERGDGLIDSADNPLSPGTGAAAWAAAECALRATDWVLDGADRSAFVAVRPPGHHAERDLAMGFCYLNTAAAAAEHAIRHHGLERVAIVDFDVHHGNGTQHIFEQRRDVFFTSLHQSPFYPGTGAASEIGAGEGLGSTLNIPLAAGADDETYGAALRDQLLPAVREYEPQLLLISAGFDAWRDDPLGGMRVTMDGYRDWGTMLATLAADVCAGRSVSLLEGGYDVECLGELVECYLEGLSGVDRGSRDPSCE